LSGDRQLFIDRDPSAIAAWCRKHISAGCIYIAPSASSRRRTIERIVNQNGISLGLNICTRGRLLSLLENRVDIATPPLLSGALERQLINEAASLAGLPLFDNKDIRAPHGAVAAISKLIRTLRLNRVTPEQFVDAGGDPRAAESYRLFEARRRELGFVDETERVDRLLHTAIPSLSLIIQEPSFADLVTMDLYVAAIGGAASCYIGIADLASDTPLPSLAGELGELNFAISRGESTITEPSIRASGGVGKQDEVELVAREMLALLRSDAEVVGEDMQLRRVRADDLLGVAPNANYLALLHDACSRLEIPVRSQRIRPAVEVPIVRALLETFLLLVNPEEDTDQRGLALLATPYVGLPLNQCDRLSRTLVLKGLGSLRSWNHVADNARSKMFAKLASSIPIIEAKLASARIPSDFASVFTSLALDFGFLSSGRRFHLDAGRDGAVRIDQQGWDALTSAMSELSQAISVSGVANMSARQWLSDLTEILGAISVRVDAKSLDGVHITIAGAGIPDSPHVFAVGWLEGVFPRRIRDDPLISERVKIALNQRGAKFPLVADRASKENERREQIRRAARQTLTISWPSTGEEGDLLLPSFYMSDLGIRNPPIRSVGDTTWPLTLAASRTERFARATLLARHRPADEAGAELEAVRKALEAMTNSEWRSYDGLLHAKQEITIPADVLNEWTPLVSSMSASQSRMVAHCLYEHFGKRRLKLEVLAPPQVDMRLIGTIAHGVLRDVGRAGFDSADIEGALASWWEKEIPDAMRANQRVLFEREMLFADLLALVASERLHLAGETKAEHFELSFGLDDKGRDSSSLVEGLVVQLQAGAPLAESTMRGSIDRVDILEREGKQYGVAIDYKSGKGERYGEEMLEMADFQLPIYCEVLPKFDIEPVGAVYLGIASGERYGVVRDDFADAFLPAHGCKGVARLSPEDFSRYMRSRQAALRVEIARLARGELAVEPRDDDCGYCDLRALCRVGTFGGAGAHGYE
jgi:hypothetical protein